MSINPISKKGMENNDILNSIINDFSSEDVTDCVADCISDCVTDNTKNKELYNEIMNKPLIHGQDILNLPLEPNDYLVENFLWRGSISILVGPEKVCKSIFTSQKAMAMTTGESFLGCFDIVKPLNVLYIQAEGDMGETKERVQKAIKDNGIQWNPELWRHHFPAALCLDVDGELDYDGNYPTGTYNELVNRIDKDEFHPDVIIIDPLYMSLAGGLIPDEPARAFCRNMRRLKEKYNCAIMVVHHQHRPVKNQFGGYVEEGDNAIYGSSMWKNFASHVIRISSVDKNGKYISPEKEGDVKYRKITCATQRNNNVIKKLILKLNQDPLFFEIENLNSTNQTIDIVLGNIKALGSATTKDIADRTGLNQRTVGNIFSKLKKDKIIVKSHKEGSWTYWKLKEGK